MNDNIIDENKKGATEISKVLEINESELDTTGGLVGKPLVPVDNKVDHSERKSD